MYKIPPRQSARGYRFLLVGEGWIADVIAIGNLFWRLERRMKIMNFNTGLLTGIFPPRIGLEECGLWKKAKR